MLVNISFWKLSNFIKVSFHLNFKIKVSHQFYQLRPNNGKKLLPSAVECEILQTDIEMCFILVWKEWVEDTMMLLNQDEVAHYSLVWAETGLFLVLVSLEDGGVIV